MNTSVKSGDGEEEGPVIRTQSEAKNSLALLFEMAKKKKAEEAAIDSSAAQEN